MKKLTLLFVMLVCFASQAQTEAELLSAAQAFPPMPRNSAGLSRFVANPTFSAGSPINDLEWTAFDTDYMDGETDGFDTYIPVDPSDLNPGTDKVKSVKCVSSLNTLASYGGTNGDRIILGTADHQNPFFMKGPDGIDNDYCAIINFDYNHGFIQLKGQASDYNLFYGTIANGCATEGWYLFYTAGDNLDLIAFIFTCSDVDVRGTSNNPLLLCNSSNSLNLTNPAQFKYASTISSTISEPNAVVQFGKKGREVMHGLTTDPAGNIYTYGATDSNLDNGNDSNNEIFVIKFDANGNQLWVTELDLVEGSLIFDAVTDNNYLYAAGRTLGNLSGFTNAGKWDGILLKLDLTTGQIVDTDQWGSIGIDGYGNITIDDAGNLYVSGAGSPTNEAIGDNSYLVAKHSIATLDNIWRQIVPPFPNGTQAAEAWGGITYVPSGTPGIGKLVVGGWYSSNSPSGTDGFLTLFGNLEQASPTILNSQPVTSPGFEADWVFDNTVDANGNIYAVGYTTGNLQGTHQGDGDAFIVKFDSNLNNPIYKQVGTTYSDMFRKLEIDTDGNLYSVGYTYGNYTTANYSGVNQDTTFLSGDVFVQKFSTNLSLLQSKQFGTPSEDRGFAHLKNNVLYVGGMTEGSLANINQGSFDGYVLALNKTTLEIQSPSLGTTENTFSKSDFMIYPNPAQNYFRTAIKNNVDANYEITDINGKILSNGKAYDNQAIDIANFQEGMYFVTIKTENAKQTYKLIKQ